MLYQGKRLLSFLLCLVMLLSLLPRFEVQAVAPEAKSVTEQGVCGPSARWTLDDNGTLTISGSGAMADYKSSVPTWYSLRTCIKAVIVDGVTSIGDYAFANCTELTDVTIGASVTTIGTYAFYRCTALEAITIPENVTTVERSAFRACDALESVCFEGNAPTLESEVFYECPEELTVRYYEGSTGYDSAAWSYVTVAPRHVGNWVIKTQPTCTTDGLRVLECTYCYSVITETIPATHQFVDDVCTVCQKRDIVASGSSGTNVFWELCGSGVLTISGSGAIPEADVTFWPEDDGTLGYEGRAPWFEYRFDISKMIVENGITGIGKYAFIGLKNVRSVSLPQGLKWIGYGAFYDCSSLSSIGIPEGVTQIDEYAFVYCSNLKSVAIPEGVTAIAKYTFKNCISLKSVSIPDTVTTIGEGAFEHCVALTDVTIPERVTGIHNIAFAECNSLRSVDLPEGLTTLGGGAFRECTSLTSVIIPESLTDIQNYTFKDCTRLTSVTIPESATHIGTGVFYNCTSLISVAIPEGVTVIDSSVFFGCSKLVSVSLPEALVSIGDYAFDGCSKLSSVTIPVRVTSIGKYAFYKCESLVSVVIPAGVSEISDSAFASCTDLTSVDIPESVTSIGDSAFNNCTSLRNIVLPESVTAIGSRAFYGCSVLEAVNIPEGVSVIGERTFYACYNLTDVTIPKSVVSIGNYAFYDCGLTCVTIPECVTDIGAYAFQYSRLKQIIFLGAPPSCGSNCFRYVSATACYPCTEPLWTQEAQTNYGGDLVWVPGHLVSSYTFNEDATCTEDGTQSGICSLCKQKVTVPAPGTVRRHSIEKGICTGCGAAFKTIYFDSYGTDCLGICVFLPDVTATGVTTKIKMDDCGDGIYSAVIPQECVEMGVSIEYAGASVGFGQHTIPDDGRNLYSYSTRTWIHYTPCSHAKQKSVVPPTCTEQGCTLYTCEQCESSLPRDVLPATGHSFDGNRVCTVCGYAPRILYFNSNGSDCTAAYAYTWEPASFGLWPGTAMTDCGYGVYSVEIPDDCVNIIFYSGNSGQQTNDLIIPNDGNNMYSWETQSWSHYTPCTHFWQTVETPVTCTEQGFATHTCTGCGLSYKDAYVEPLGHNPDENGVIEVKPTCSQSGQTKLTCDRCGETVIATLPATGHKFDTDGVCANCGMTERIRTVYFDSNGTGWTSVYVYVWKDLSTEAFGPWPGILMKDHGDGIYSIDVPDRYPNIIFNCGTSGVASGNQTADLRIPEDDVPLYSFANNRWESPLVGCDHNMQATVEAPTCTEQGYTVIACTKCGQIAQEKVLPATGHTFVDGKCHCGKLEMGDVSGDGKINIGDVSKVFAHVRKKNNLTDEEALASADVNGDGKINLGDVARIFAHVRGKNPLF